MPHVFSWSRRQKSPRLEFRSRPALLCRMIRGYRTNQLSVNEYGFLAKDELE